MRCVTDVSLRSGAVESERDVLGGAGWTHLRGKGLRGSTSEPQQTAIRTGESGEEGCRHYEGQPSGYVGCILSPETSKMLRNHGSAEAQAQEDVASAQQMARDAMPKDTVMLIERAISGSTYCPPVVMQTWDFAGQEMYYCMAHVLLGAI